MLVKHAVVFVAGLGSRLRPWTLATPKPLLNHQGQPLLSYTLQAAANNGVTDLWLNPGYLGQQIKDYCGDGDQWGLSIHYHDEPADNLLETGGTLTQLSSLIQERFWIISGDVFFEWPSLPQHHGDHIWLHQHQHHDFSINHHQHLSLEQPNLTYTGIGILSPKTVNTFRHRTLGGLLKNAIEGGHIIHASLLQGSWHNFNTINDFLAYDECL
ncbi:MAG: nucleotidyltransferase family protein [Candidatus Comchoanobacterales bacterium]